MPQIAINTRALSTPLTGVQRYTRELLARWDGQVQRITPRSALHGLRGHAWEQIVLPQQLNGTLLFSPSNSGPIGLRNQVVTIHDMVYFDHPETLNRTFAAWYQFLLPQLARRVRRIITVSQFIKERVIATTKVAAESVVVIPNGVDARFSPRAVTKLDEAVSRLGLPSHEYILALGSIEPRKNLARLLRAWDRVQSSVSRNVWLVVAGGKGNPAIFRNGFPPSVQPKRVFLTGHVDDDILPALCAGAIAMAYPSIYEGFGLPALEAMASGVPIIAGNCPALREVVGDAGILVNPYAEDQICEALVRVIHDEHLRSELRSKGLTRAAGFSWDNTAHRTWEVLQQAS